VPRTNVPPREWLAVVLPPTFAVVVLSAAAVDAGASAQGWLAFGCAFVGGLVPPLVYTVVLAREDRLFLRGARQIRRNRARTTAAAIPVGWAVGAALVIASALVGDVVRVTLFAALGGAMLGFWPGLLANFARLRREEWTS
jgi:hypothetical protein